ncbi:MAG: uracil-xanthine permease family protein [Lachnospiraceae bacterium]
MEKGNETSPLTVAVNQKMSPGELILFAVQHLLGITFLLVVPGLIGAACGLSDAEVGYLVQACFFTVGLVTILQSCFMLKLPAVHGPTAVFMSAILTTGVAFGLGTAYGSLFVAGGIVALLSIPIKKFGLIGKCTKFLTAPIVFGTLLLIIGTQLSQIAIPGSFGTAGTTGYPWLGISTAVITILATIGFMLFGKDGIMKRGAMLWGIIIGTICYAVIGGIDISSVASASVVSAPKLFPFGFSINPGVVVLMLLAYLHSTSEALGMYNLLAGWDNQKVSEQRANGGIFGMAIGNMIGSAIGGVPTTTYPENVGIIRVTGVGSRFATCLMGVMALLLGFFPKIGMLIAVIPSSVLSGATVVLFGMIAFSGVQHLKEVAWDDMNIVTAAVPFIIALGCMFLPESVTSLLPVSVQSIVTQPMLVGIILLVIFNAVINMLLRPIQERKNSKSK